MQELRIIRSKRRTVGIVITPDGEVVVRAPLRLSERRIKEIVNEKSAWIERHLSKIQMDAEEAEKQGLLRPALKGIPQWLSSKEPACNAGASGNVGLIPRSRRFPWRSTWQSTLIFLPGEFHEQRSLVGYSP